MTTVDLGYVPRAWQAAVHIGMSTRRFGVIVVHRRAGKSVLAVMHLIDRACKLALPNGRYAYLAPKLNQAKAIAWHYLKQYTLKIPGTVANESELHITLPNGAQIRIFGADNPDALRGLYMDGVVLDEAADLPADLWDSVLLPQLLDRSGWALFMGTPKGQNLLSDKYHYAKDHPDEWYSGRYTVDQTDAITATELAMARQQMPPQKFQREMMCDFDASVEDILLSIEEVHTASRRCYHVGDFQHAPKVIGVDVARQGDDSTAIVRRQGLMSWAPRKMKGANAMEVADQVAYEINDWRPDAVFIDGTGGYGAGVIDRLRQLGHRVIEVQFAGKPNSPKFLNKRAEMWWDMAEWIKKEGQIAGTPDLVRDLTSPTYEFRGDKIVLESKEDMKARGRPSPDEGDSVALTFAATIHCRSDYWDGFHDDAPKKPFNPLGRVLTYR